MSGCAHLNTQPCLIAALAVHDRGARSRRSGALAAQMPGLRECENPEGQLTGFNR